MRKRHGLCVKPDHKAALRVRVQADVCGQPPVHREGRPHAHGLAAQQCAGNVLYILWVDHCAAMAFRPVVDCEHVAPVGRGRDDRLRAEAVRQALGQLVRPAEVPGQHRDHEPPRIVDHNDRRVIRLARKVWCDRAHRDARRAHEYDQVTVHHRLLRKARKRGAGERRVDRVGIPLGEKVRQQRRGPRRRARADFGKGHELRVLHLLASRNPVVNAGSYSLERSYSSPRKPPTVMSAVLVTPSRFAASASPATVVRMTFSSGQVAL